MRAASLAQQATDYILNLNAKGEPAFLAELAKINPEKEEKKTKKATKKPQKNTENPEHHKYFQEKKKEAEIQLKEAIERVKKSNYRNTAVEYAQVVALKCEMIKHIEENAKLYNATPAELEYIRLYLSYLTIDQVKYHFIKNDHYMSTDMVGLKPHFSRLFSKTRPKAFAKVKDRKYSYKLNENGKKFINDYVELYENFYKNPPTFEDNKIAEAEGVSTENVEDSSKKKVEKAPAKATKSLKSRKEKGENVANFTLLQEPTKVFLEFEDEKNQAYYKNSADKQGAVGADFLKRVLKDLKKQNLREEPRGFINTEDFPVSPTISKVTGIDSLKTVVVKDKNRPTLECVLIEADRYVATDLYNIILLNRPKNDGLKTGALYDPNYKCTNIGGCSKEEYYRDIEIGYPNYKAILTKNPVYTSDWVAIEPFIKHLKSGLEVIRKIYDWKRVYVVKITSNVGEGHYNLKYLLNDLQILQSNGAKKIRLYTNKLDEKLNIETDNGNIVVTMAVYIGDRSNYDVISPLRIAPIQLHFTQNRKEEKGLSGVDYSQGLFGAVGLNAPHHEGILKEALNECGRLKKGWKFEKGKAVKVETKKGKDKEGEQKELDLYMQEMKMAIKESKAGKFDKKNILSWLSKFPDKVKGLLYNFLYHHYLLDQEEAKLRKSKKLVPFGLISVQAGISEFVSKLMDLEREDFFDLYFFFRDNMDECIELLEDKEVKKNYYEKKKKGLSGVDYSQGLFGAVPEVSTERFKKMKVNELRAFTLRYYNLFLKGDSVTIERHLKEVVFTNKAGRKIAHGEAMYSEKAAVIAQLKTLIKNSTYNNWGDRKPQDHPDILGYLNFKSKITIDGEKRHLRISIIVDKDRKLKLKSYDVGKKKSRDPQGGLPSAEGSQLFKAVQSTQEPVATLQDEGIEPLSEDKGTKKSLSRKKKEENFGLNASEPPVTSLPVPRQTLAQQLATRPEVRESFLVADEQMSLFLGAL
ncbi:MAG: hypothetical protein D8H93_23825, partial [Capnocytophaga sp.]